MSKVIEIEDFSDDRLFEDLNISVEKNKITTISGSNSCGKTTLIKILNREIITDNYADALEADFLKYLYEEKNFESHCSDLGIYGNEVLRYTYTGSSTSTVSPSDEADYEIPARTMYNSRYTYEMTWVKGILKTFVIHQTMSYKIEETQYKRLTDIEFSYLVNNDVKIELPNPKEYKEVDDIFSL